MFRLHTISSTGLTKRYLQDGRRRWTEVGKKKVDPLFRECYFDYIFSSSK